MFASARVLSVVFAFFWGGLTVNAQDTENNTNPNAPISVISQLFQFFAEGKIDELMNLFDENVVQFEPGPRSLLPWAGTFQGHEGMQEFLQSLGSLEHQEIDIHEMIPVGDRVIVRGQEIGRFRSTGKTYVTESVWFWTVRNGKIVAMTAYHDTFAMVDAARPEAAK